MQRSDVRLVCQSPFLSEENAYEVSLQPSALAQVYYRGMPEDPGGSGMPLRRHGDEVERLPNGYYRALGRCDDTMNLGGIKARTYSDRGPWLLHLVSRCDVL